MEVLGQSSKDAERSAREVRKRVRAVLGDEAAPTLVDDAAVSLVGMFNGDQSSGFNHAKHAEVSHRQSNQSVAKTKRNSPAKTAHYPTRLS